MTRFDPGLAAAVFLGPSLPRTEAAKILPANYFGPAGFGDVYRLISTGIELIVLIDGVFHLRPAVWPREILEAMDEGLVVIGGSSMGALRAAELHTLGMLGSGTIFEWYKSGAIDGDDEVALLHADEASGYRPLSIPLVDLRHRVRTLVEQGQLAPAHGDLILARQKRRAFGDRTSQTLAEDAHGLFAGTWPAESLKRADAIEVLNAAASIVGLPPPRRGVHAGDLYTGTARRHRGYFDATSNSLRTIEEILRPDALEPTLREEVETEARRRFYLRRTPEWQELSAEPPLPSGATFPSVGELVARSVDEAVVERHGLDGARSAIARWARGLGLGPEDMSEEERFRWLLASGPESFGFLFVPLEEMMAAELAARGDLERLSLALADAGSERSFARAPEVARVRLARADRLIAEGDGAGAVDVLWPLFRRRPFDAAVGPLLSRFSAALAASSRHADLGALHARISEVWRRYDQRFGDFGLFYQSYDRVLLPGQRDSAARFAAYGLDELLGPSTEVVDIGCNTGVMSLLCAERGSRVVGFDVDRELIEIARLLAEFTGSSARFVVSTVSGFAPTNEVDLILSCAVHRWIGMPAAEYAALLRTWLSPGGHVLLESQGARLLDAVEVGFHACVDAFVDAGFRAGRVGEICDDGMSLRRFVLLRRAD